MSAAFESFDRPSLRPRAVAHSASEAAPTSGLFIWSLRLLCGAALLVTGYLAVTALRSDDVAGCAAGQLWNCEHALNSRWSKVFGIPVSVPAAGLYAALLVALATCRAAGRAAQQRLAWATITAGALVAGLAAIWFVGLQVFALGHLCIYCLAAHLCGVGLCLAVLWKRPLGSAATARFAVVGLLAVGGLIGGQVLAEPPPTYTIERYQAAEEGNPAPVIEAPGTPSSGSAQGSSTRSDSTSSGTPREAHKPAPEFFEAPPVPPADAAPMNPETADATSADNIQQGSKR
jgi:uncharacterized membrane protein